MVSSVSPAATAVRSPIELIRRLPVATALCALIAAASVTPAAGQGRHTGNWWSGKVDSSLATAGANRKELKKALDAVPADERAGLQFLLENMPEPDLRSLSADFLLQNLKIAYDGYNRAPWKAGISEELFLNDILPYACLTEKRDDSRQFLNAKAVQLVAGSRNPGEAAQILNQKLFPLLNAKYSTERKRPDQSPIETAESGKATCSGLSILLVDACRCVGIPARVVGTPMWTNNRGNHTWVEVWDDGWHYLGAAEPDPKGLDHAWFAGDAAKAQRDVPEHAIYATSFRKTGISFPLAWAPSTRWVNAENVTDRYAAGTAAVDSAKSRILVKVLDAEGRRIAVPVSLQVKGETPQTGVSKAGTADLNDMLHFDVFRTCPPRQYQLSAVIRGVTLTRMVMAGVDAEQQVTLRAPSASEAKMADLLAHRFGTDSALRAASMVKLQTMRADASGRAAAWAAYAQSNAHDALKKQFEDKIVATDDRTSPYLWRHVGTKPAGGWALVIAMHGGGNAPKEVNDREWQYMFSTYYREHPEAGGYVYLALRAPNDTWNGFYDDAISPLIEKLIKQFVIFDDVNPNKVYVMGASHGGYGAYVIGPKIPYRFAAVHAAAAAPTGGETMGENLRNVRFTTMVGERDTAYGRIDLSRKFETQVDAWRSKYGGFSSEFTFPANTGHLVPDHDVLATMLKYTREAWPHDIVWTQSDKILKRNYWVEALEPVPGGHIEADVKGNEIEVRSSHQKGIVLWLDSRLIDLSKPVIVTLDGVKRSHRVFPTLETYCEGLEETADPDLAAPVRLDIDPPAVTITAPAAGEPRAQSVVSIHVDPSQERHPISPLVYGVNFASPEQLELLNSPIDRSGGNATTRYNWKQNCTSSGNDWFFMSHPENGSEPGESVDAWINGNEKAHAKSMVSIPLIGWVAKIKPDRSPLWSFSVAKYGAQQRTEQYHPDMGNGNKPDGKPITGNDPTDANMKVDISYQKGWLEHLVNKFGTADKGGVSYYLLDNEPGIWQGTHRDVFPTGVKMEDLFERELGAARLVKSIDHSALVAGPEEWGWTNYLYSGYDSQWAGEHGWDKPKPDRSAHGDTDIMPWLLKQFANAQKSSGERLLDVFTLHFYPQAQGVGGDDVSEQTKLRRNRSTRALWDPNYKDESWIATQVELIPRMKRWVAENYPGTKIGITEYNWGAEKNMSGALAQADVLGIFGREGVDLATRWVCPATGTPTFLAIQMYRNYDGKGSTFGDISVKCSGGNPDSMAAFGSQVGKDGPLKVMLINKQPGEPAPVKVDMEHFAGATAAVYQLTSSNKIVKLPDVKVSGSSVSLNLPPESVTLVVVR